MRKIAVLVLVLAPGLARTEEPQKRRVELSGFVDGFYAYNFNRSEGDHENFFPGVGTSAKRDHEFAVNLAELDLSRARQDARNAVRVCRRQALALVQRHRRAGAGRQRQRPAGAVRHRGAVQGDSVVHLRRLGGHRARGAAGARRRQLVRHRPLWTAHMAFAARAEYCDDEDGAISGTAQTLRAVTLTWEHRPVAALIVKVEARYDRSSADVFAGNEVDADSASIPSEHDQTLVLVGVVALF